MLVTNGSSLVFTGARYLRRAALSIIIVDNRTEYTEHHVAPAISTTLIVLSGIYGCLNDDNKEHVIASTRRTESQ